MSISKYFIASNVTDDTPLQQPSLYHAAEQDNTDPGALQKHRSLFSSQATSDKTVPAPDYKGEDAGDVQPFIATSGKHRSCTPELLRRRVHEEESELSLEPIRPPATSFVHGRFDKQFGSGGAPAPSVSDHLNSLSPSVASASDSCKFLDRVDEGVADDYVCYGGNSKNRASADNDRMSGFKRVSRSYDPRGNTDLSANIMDNARVGAASVINGGFHSSDQGFRREEGYSRPQDGAPHTMNSNNTTKPCELSYHDKELEEVEEIDELFGNFNIVEERQQVQAEGKHLALSYGSQPVRNCDVNEQPLQQASVELVGGSGSDESDDDDDLFQDADTGKELVLHPGYAIQEEGVLCITMLPFSLDLHEVGGYEDVINTVPSVPGKKIRTVQEARERDDELKTKLNELQSVRRWLWIKQAGTGVLGVVGGAFTMGAATVVAAGGGLHQRNRLQQVKRAMRQVIRQMNEVRSSRFVEDEQWMALTSEVQIEDGVFTRGIDREELRGEL